METVKKIQRIIQLESAQGVRDCTATPRIGPRTAMLFKALDVAGAFLIEQERRHDERGYFARVFCEAELRSHNLTSNICQVNTAVSSRARTLRGLHFQADPHAEVKIVRCARGAVYDVLVDLRPSSLTFKRWFGATLTHVNGTMLYVPAGCAHGYLTLEPDTELTYFTSAAYAPAAARGVRYNDSAFGISWPASPAVISAADESWPDFEGPDSSRKES